MSHSSSGKKGVFIKKAFLLIIGVFFAFSVSSLGQLNSKNNDKIKIVATVFPLMEFAKAVAGDRGEVSLLLPPGAEIHTWQPRPSDIIRLSSSDIFVYIGSSLEPWVDDIVRSVRNPNLRPVEASQGLSLIGEDEHSAADPHIWLDFENDLKILEKIEAVLAEVEPASASFFKKNASLYKQKLQLLDEKYKDVLKHCAHRTFIIGGHAAFGYLARRYKLQQIALYGISPDARPSPRKLVEVMEMVKKLGINVVFFEVFISSELARTIAEQVGARTLVLNPGANLTREQLKSGATFFDIMENNLENLKSGLGCN